MNDLVSVAAIVRKQSLALAAVVVLSVLVLAAIFAGFFSPYSPTEDEFRNYFYHPPTVVRFTNFEGKLRLWPHVRRTFIVDSSKPQYSELPPIRIYFRAPEFNKNPYVRDIASQPSLLKITGPNHAVIGTISNAVETDTDSGFFYAAADVSAKIRGDFLTIHTPTGQSMNIRVSGGGPVPIERPRSTDIYITDEQGRYVEGYNPRGESYPIRLFVRGGSYKVLGLIRSNVHLFGVDQPAHVFLLGSDQAGRDVLSRILHGAQVSLIVSLAGVLLTTMLGLTFGGIAGFYRGATDAVLMRCAEVLMAVPALYLVLSLGSLIPRHPAETYMKLESFFTDTFAWQNSTPVYISVVLVYILLSSYYSYRTQFRIRSLLLASSGLLLIVCGRGLGLSIVSALQAAIPPNEPLSPAAAYLLLILLLSSIGWAPMARVIRGMVLSLREQEYVLAAKALGASTTRTLIRHILPGTFDYVIVRATLLIPSLIVAEVTLSYLGFGVKEPAPSWGNMLHAAQDLQVLEQFTWMLSPGIFLLVTVLCLNFIGESLRGTLNPKTDSYKMSTMTGALQPSI